MHISNVFTRPYQHLTTKASIELHYITCVSLDDIWLWDLETEHVCAEYEPLETNSLPFNKSFLAINFDELSDNNVSEDGLSISVSVDVNKQIS